MSLERLFAPKTVAVVGATESPGSVGLTLMKNLRRHFSGAVIPVHPTLTSVLDVPAFRAIGDVPQGVDLAVIATPASIVPGIVRQCVEAAVPNAVIISAGFRECGPGGAALERDVAAEARRGALRIIGPNCLGVMRPSTGLNATFAAHMARPGRVAFLSQSGALCTAVLDWSLREHVGFSAFVSVGSMLDVGWGDLIDFFGRDEETASIVLYMESIGNAAAFVAAARRVARAKPIIAIKAGRTAAAAHAAASHTGALAGSDRVLDAALQRCGVLRVDTIDELFAMADVLGKQPAPTGPNLTIVTNAGGPAVLATDALIASGGALTPLGADTLQRFDALLPAPWSHGNPVDILGDASPERYARALTVAAGDSASDGILVILTPQAMTDPTRTAEAVVAQTAAIRKPVLASWMGGADVEPGQGVLAQAHLPVFEYPDTAARVFGHMWRHAENLRRLDAPPEPAADRPAVAAGVADRIGAVVARDRTLLTEHESKQVLAAYGIAVVATRLVTSEDEAVAAAEAIGFPVVMKLHSETIAHKSDVGGVRLNLGDGAAVREAYRGIHVSVAAKATAADFLGVTLQPMIVDRGYELIVGSHTDPQFGPVLLFGAGGTLVEVYEDTTLGLPPLDAALARQMMRHTRIHKALLGVRGQPPVDLAAIERLLVRVGDLAVAHPRIASIDINPLLATPAQVAVLDARIVLHPASVPDSDLPVAAFRW